MDYIPLGADALLASLTLEEGKADIIMPRLVRKRTDQV